MYVPTMVPENPAALPAYLSNELQSLAKSLIQSQPFAFLQTLHAAPTKPQAGMVVLADGTDWDPGSGAGFYGYRGAAWHLLG